MYSKEEIKQVRQDFWTFFGKRYQRKWTLYDTKMKDVVLKFTFEDSRALVSLDLTHSDTFFRTYYWEKIERLKSLLLEKVSSELVFDANYVVESGKEIARVYVAMDHVKIQKKTDWPNVYAFFYDNMDRLEAFYWEYKDILDS